MIRITVKRTEDHISCLEIKGHAGSDDYGHDLVCAVVSGIAVGMANAVDQLLKEDDIIVDEGYVRIHIQKPDDKSDLIMKTGLIELQTAAEVNQDYIRITEV